MKIVQRITRLMKMVEIDFVSAVWIFIKFPCCFVSFVYIYLCIDFMALELFLWCTRDIVVNGIKSFT